MTPARRFSFAAVALATVVGCASTTEPSATQTQPVGDDADVMSKEQVASLMKTSLQSLCMYAQMREQRGEQACKDETLVSVCDQMKDTLDDSVASLLTHPTPAGLIKSDADRAELASQVKADFEGALDVCFNGQAARMKAEEKRIENDPEIQKLVAAGRDRYWHMSMRGLARAIRDGATAPKGGVTKSLRKLVQRGACTVGARFMGDMMKVGAGPDNAQAAACVATMGDVCSAAGGFINLSDWPYMQSDDEVVKYLEDIASFGIESLCRLGGRVSSVACGAISVAMGQIRKAIETGTNDWYQCSGLGQYLDPIAEDVGWYIGADGWTSNMPIAKARTSETKSGQPIVVRECCTCDKVDIVRNRGWVRDVDEELNRSTYVSVIQSGGYEGGNCAYKNGREYVDDPNPSYWDNQRRLHRYEGCRRVYVVGEVCSLTRNAQPNPLVVWDNDQRSPSGEILR